MAIVFWQGEVRRPFSRSRALHEGTSNRIRFCFGFVRRQATNIRLESVKLTESTGNETVVIATHRHPLFDKRQID